MYSESETEEKTDLLTVKTKEPTFTVLKIDGQNTEMRLRCSVLLRFLIALVVIFLIIGCYIKLSVPDFYQYRRLQSYNPPIEPNKQRPRTILLWTSFFGDTRWALPNDTFGPDTFRDELHCSVYTCELTSNRDFLPDVNMYDAIVFHGARSFDPFETLPNRRSPAQAYVFASMESPAHTKHDLSGDFNFYNWTMTYRQDSDIVWPYRHIYDIETGLIAAPSESFKWRQPPARWNDSEILKLWPNKSRTAAWFVSHCNTYSKRDELTAALQKYIDVDVYGSCGTLKCDRSLDNCDELLDQNYKFYFAFENSLCIDYVTEKAFNALHRNLIPVVYGGANYSQFLPPHSYINAESFDTAFQLSEYLKYLSGNVNEYMRYFWWRKYYRLGNQSPFCDMCKKLHSSSFLHKKQTYTNILEWWQQNICRKEPHIRF